jgi:hypothetical protein
MRSRRHHRDGAFSRGGYGELNTGLTEGSQHGVNGNLNNGVNGVNGVHGTSAFVNKVKAAADAAEGVARRIQTAGGEFRNSVCAYAGTAASMVLRVSEADRLIEGDVRTA